jgi:hypothetical protein
MAKNRFLDIVHIGMDPVVDITERLAPDLAEKRILYEVRVGREQYFEQFVGQRPFELNLT